jgi:hypothetical protein
MKAHIFEPVCARSGCATTGIPLVYYSGIPVGTALLCLSIQPSYAKVYRKCTTHILTLFDVYMELEQEWIHQ